MTEYLARPFFILSATLVLSLSVVGQATVYSIPNDVYQGAIQMQENSGLYPLDGPKLTPWPNATSYDWWYFDVVSTSNNASFVSTFFLNRGAFRGVNETAPNVVDASVTFPNGTAVDTTTFVDLNENVTVTTLGNGSSGDWTGTGANWNGSPDLKSYTINYNSSAIKGSIVLTSVSPAHYPCNKAEPFSDELLCPNVGWANSIPDSNAVVDLTVNGERLAFTGYGYHDKNWGDINFAEAIKSWYWGHGRLGPYSIVWFDALGTDGTEYVSSWVTDDGTIIAGNCTSGSLRVRPFGTNATYPPDPTSPLPDGYSISYDLGAKGTLDVNFTRELHFFSTPTYNRFLGNLEGGITGEQNFTGQALCEQFAF
ncbi:hypothetical protein PV08_04519 [Exophiala spinifera]|uniref:AttH domain-containing protein n=1 Tax=Exophiala spinifera TaxID=91928 RepID=A0A0D1ZXB7_9EURO|nr:uncharacterized protein PV08_04519 [Exophiala spinifera]KIW17327.1 hypothetical protein PV08_04519 [Exophiala spinifera]